MTTATLPPSAASDPGARPPTEAGAEAVVRFSRVHGVRWVHAVLAGPVAWGIPAWPGDDAPQCRAAGFFVRPAETYRSLVEPPDVLTDADGPLPVVAWDLKRVLRLFLRSNAALWDWIAAPDRLAGDPALADALITLGAAHYGRPALVGHSLGAAKQAMNAYVQDAGRPAARIKYLHMVRALLACAWAVDSASGQPLPPPDLARLRRGTAADGTPLIEGEAAAALDILVAGTPPEGTRIKVLDIWIDSVFEKAKAALEEEGRLFDGPPPLEPLDTLYRRHLIV